MMQLAGRHPRFQPQTLISLAIGLQLVAVFYFSMLNRTLLPFIVACSAVLLIFVFFFKRQALLNYFMLFGLFYFPSLGKMGGLVSVNWARIAILDFLYAFYILTLAYRLPRLLRNRDVLVFFMLCFPWILWLLVSVTWSLSPVDAFRYIPKVVLGMLIAVCLLLEDGLTTRRALDLLLIGITLFVVAATPYTRFQYNYEPTSWIVGIFGRNSAKFALVFGILLAWNALNHGYHRKKSLFIVGFGTLWLLLLLQRGSMIALFTAALVMWLLSARLNLRRMVQALIAVLAMGLAIWFVFYTERFKIYMFVPGFGPADMITTLVSEGPSAALDLVNFKGRWEMWDFAMQQGLSVFGEGFGSTTKYMEEYFGFVCEIHNDHLQYLLDLGFLGYSLVMMMWGGFLTLSLRYHQSMDNLTRMLAISLGTYSAGLFAWNFVDHVFSYGDVSMGYMFILAALLVKRRVELKDAGHTDSRPVDLRHGVAGT